VARLDYQPQKFMKTKILLGSVVSILIMGMVAAAVWRGLRPQTITMSDDSKLTLVAVEYGKKHAPPTVKTPAGTRVRRGNSFTTTNDTLVVWVRQQYDSKQYHYFQYFAYDQAGTACVGASFASGGGNRQGNEVVGIRLDAFPRRESKFILRVQENSNDGQELSDQKFVIRNPARSSFLEWTPDSLPNTEEDDDLSVTLTKLVAGAAMTYTRDNDDPDDAINKGVQATFNVERNGKPVTNWEPVSVQTSDAAGNYVSAAVAGNQWDGDDDAATYQYGLWPDEPAWKIRLEFSQQSDFAGDELWSVQGIPLQSGRQQDFFNFGGRRQQTNSVFAETELNGFRLKIFSGKQFTDVSPNSQPQGGLTIQTTPSLPNGMRLTLVKLTDDQTNDIGYWNFGTFGNGNSTTYRYGLRDLDGATNLNLAIALHKSRFVEFTVKPEKSSDTNSP
jgi:flagellar basal body-associated protein FliL